MDSKAWGRGTSQTGEDAFSLERWFSACGLKALRNTMVQQRAGKSAPKRQTKYLSYSHSWKTTSPGESPH